jgi:uncharacterized protein (DUF1501 family)
MALTRRQFLKRSAASAAGAALAPHLRMLRGTNVAYAAGPGDAIVVFVQLFGGNDGLNTVYPLTGSQRSLYEEFRPTLKLPKTSGELTPWASEGFDVSSILSVGANDDGADYAFHPAMKALHDVYQQGKVAVVHGVHYPFPNHSHFRSEEIWYTADPRATGGPGWFGAYLNHAGFTATDVPGVILDGSVNPLFTPTTAGLFTFRRLSELEFPAEGEPALKQATVRALYDESSTAPGALYPELVKIGETGVATLDKINEYYLPGSGLGNAGQVEALMLNEEGRYRPDNPLVYDSPLNFSTNPDLAGLRLARDLRHVAAVIRADVGARFFHVGIGGFDSHSSQEKGFFHSYLLREVSEAIAAFYGEMTQAVSLPGGYSGYLTGNLGNKVLIVSLSEFGRTMRQNAANAGTAGTDHATSACQLVVGDPVIGGQFGAHPQLDEPGSENDDDMRLTYDFRDFFGTVLARWLNVSEGDLGPGPGKILPATTEADGDGNSYTEFNPIEFIPE